MQRSIVQDSGCANGRISVQVPCCQAHFGLCVTDDATFVQDAVAAGKKCNTLFCKELKDLKAASALLVEGQWEDNQKHSLFCFFSSKKGGTQQPFTLFTMANLTEEGDESFLQPDCTDSGMLRHMYNFMLVRKFFSVQHPGGPLATVSVTVLDTIQPDSNGRPVSQCLWRGKRKLAHHTCWSRLQADRQREAAGEEAVALDALGEMFQKAFLGLRGNA